MASAKWRVGRTCETASSQSGAADIWKNTLLMNSAGRTTAFTIAGAASALGMTPERASPSALNVTAATTSTASIAGTASHGTGTPYSSAPNPATITTSRNAIATA